MTSLRDRMSKGLGITLSAEDEATAANMRPAGPTTGPGQTMQIAALRKQLDEARQQLAARDGEAAAATAAAERVKELEAALASATTIDIPLDRLREEPGRRRYMSPEKYAELRENIRQHGMVQPIIVRRRPDGDYELVSGHHRSDVHRDLECSTIRGVVEEGTADEAEDRAFWANLMQSDLTDYEKYIGLKRFHAKNTELNQSELAERVGITQSHVSMLFAFDRLPEEAHAILATHQSAVGATLAAKLAALTEAGKGTRVAEAIKRLSEQEMEQEQAVRFVKDGDRPKSATPAADTFKVKAGKRTWCDVRRARNVMRIEFHSEEIAQAVTEAIREKLETLAAQTTQTQS